MKFIKIPITIALVAIITGCASGLNSIQKREYSAFEQDGVLIKEKNPTTGFILGFLPGGGSFYAREPGLGVVNLLLWPVSILWDPVSGSDGSQAINYDLTKHQLKKDRNKDLSDLEDRLLLDPKNKKEYLIKKRRIKEKYDYE